jgi:hypothetical protein
MSKVISICYLDKYFMPYIVVINLFSNTFTEVTVEVSVNNTN